MIEFKDFSFKYENSDKNALSNINLKINKGDFLGIIGESGAGKTSFSYAINGIIPHHFKGDFYGEVIIDEKDTVETKPEILAYSVGSVFQDIDGQMVASVVEDELLFGLENFGIDKSEIKDRIDYSVKTLGIENLKNRTIASLSGGQKQKVAIASILALKPKILVLDEPTGELDPKSSRNIFEILKDLNQNHGITIIVIEQKIMLLCEFVKSLLVLNGGEVASYGDTHEVLQQAKKLEEIGVNVPRIVTLANILKERNLYNGETPVNLSEAKKMLDEVMK